MGRVLDKRVVAISCDVKRCDEQRNFGPFVAPSTWHDEVAELGKLALDGWGFVLRPRLAAFCPEHSGRVWDCSCRTNPAYVKNCTAHSTDAADLVWIGSTVPGDVNEFFELSQEVAS